MDLKVQVVLKALAVLNQVVENQMFISLLVVLKVALSVMVALVVPQVILVVPIAQKAKVALVVTQVVLKVDPIVVM